VEGKVLYVQNNIQDVPCVWKHKGKRRWKTTYICPFNNSRIVQKLHEEKCYIWKRTDIELPACENTKVCCVVKIQQIFINFNSWLTFGVGSDWRKYLNVMGCFPTMIH